ncbi:hypothetical protein BH09PSE1_BH09PSE1_14970 [soil metagenome]
MRRIVFAATVSAFALLAGASLAQTAPQLRVGDSVSGALDDSDPTLGTEADGQYRYEDYKITVRRGQRLEAILRSDDFDAYLQVFAAGQEGADGEALAEDDDGLGDGTTHSRLRFVAPENGTYTLRARTLSGLEGGDFSLSLAQRPPAPRAPRPAGIRVGASVEGTINDRDPESDDDGGHYDAYVFRAAADQRFAVALNSDAFDPVVKVGQMEGGTFVEAASNDDGVGIGLNSYLIFTAPRAGEYVIHAAPLGSDGTGASTLKLDDAPPPLAATPIEIGGSVDGELSDSDGVNDGGAKADAYTFTATAGQRIDATLNSEDFDTYLELFNAAGESLDQDDDGGEEGTNSRLIATLKDGGEYTLQVRATGDDTTGAYTLALAEAAPEPVPVALPFATVTQGEIEEGGARDDDGRGYDAYTFSGEAGTRVQVVMRSGDFDTYLQISKAGEFEALGSDDDGLGEGTDSRLNYILPETGEYVIRASPLGDEEKGLYSIELTDKGPQPEPGSILIGATARGTLSDNDGLADDGAYFDAYTIQVAEGDKIDVTLVSNDFDAYIDIGRDKDGTWDSVASDDDSLSDTHAKVEWTVDEAGTYTIRARSFAPTQTGAYALTVERKP